MVRGTGVEPARDFSQQPLKLPCLPVSPPAQNFHFFALNFRRAIFCLRVNALSANSFIKRMPSSFFLAEILRPLSLFSISVSQPNIILVFQAPLIPVYLLNLYRARKLFSSLPNLLVKQLSNSTFRF